MGKPGVYLIDTQIFIWFSAESRKLKKDIYEILINPENLIFVSVATVWEIIIKKSKGKLKTPGNIKTAVETNRFNTLPVNLDHVLALRRLPKHHNDPFDRILIAQARTEKLTLISADKKIWKYKVNLLKA